MNICMKVCRKVGHCGLLKLARNWQEIGARNWAKEIGTKQVARSGVLAVFWQCPIHISRS